ncbi:MAG: TlyA family RNA methyltransferase [Propionibacteriaceae bacterium]|nr:TlyA family RNA methyltransferase [Propionibacteriaceae bacterium]
MRLDRALAERGLARSRNQASRLIAAGRVKVAGVVVTRASFEVAGHEIEVDAEPYVSRAAYKLIGALDASGTAVPARVLDAGASTGGFSQVLLERGAHRVYAVDVGHGQLAAEVRDDPRVVSREGLNLRDLTLSDLDGEPVGLIAGDVSFISLTLLVEPLRRVVAPGGVALLLVKPQFEVGREALGKAGVVADPELRERAVEAVLTAARHCGWLPDWRGVSVLPGGDGNVEHFVRLVAQGPGQTG